jgi:uncharacterized protein
MRRVLYFHGFASSPRSAKIVALRPLLEPLGVELVTPDLNVPDFEHLDWGAMIDLAVASGTAVHPSAIVGSSLGALVALEVVRRGVSAPLVLIAPAIGIGARWLARLPAGDPVVVFNHARGADVSIHRAFFEQMNEVDTDHSPPAVPVTVLMGRRDESVPFELVSERWNEWLAAGVLPQSKFIDIADGDHGFAAYADVIAREITAAAGLR